MTAGNAAGKLVVLWTSGDREVAEKMVFMYTLNARVREWWQDVTLIVWGPSARLLVNDADLQDYLKKLQEAGVKVMACKACTDSYGVSASLASLGIEVKYMGEPFTHYLQGDYKVITI